MQLLPLDFSKIKAIGHDNNTPLGNLQVLIASEDGTLKLQQIPAPSQALEGLKLLANLTASDQVMQTPTLSTTEITMIFTSDLPCNGSSNVEAFGYQSGILQVDFRSGSRYQYFDVPYSVFRGFLTASSAGVYLNREIKPNFRFEQIF